MPRVSIVTLGCPKNAVDSEALGGLLANGGHTMVEDPETADVVLLNTCGFIDPARKETIDEALALADLKDGDVRGLVLTGCLVARSGPDLERALPEVDALVDFEAYPRIAQIVSDVADGSLDQRLHGATGPRFDPAWWDASIATSPRLRFGRAPWTYLKIAEGCDRGCTFCAIPLMRGKFRSRSPDVIVNEAHRLVAAGVTELSLVSQDSVMWGRDLGDADLIALLEDLERVEGLRRIRLMYLHPRGLTDELIDKVLSSEVVVSYFDLSLQHVAVDVLRAMGRWGGRGRFEKMIDRIRKQDPLAAVRATFILGFPGETDAEADEVTRFVSETELDWVGVFVYSREEGTRSFAMESQVPAVVARERAEIVSAAAERTMERRAEVLHGRRLEVLIERWDREEERWVGRSHREAPEIDGEIMLASKRPLAVGDYVSAVVAGRSGTDLEATVQEQPSR